MFFPFVKSTSETKNFVQTVRFPCYDYFDDIEKPGRYFKSLKPSYQTNKAQFLMFMCNFTSNLNIHPTRGINRIIGEIVIGQAKNKYFNTNEYSEANMKT